ncbi:MAG TPA: S9 family peptidase [Terriglobales bacterium]|nr:S9 family peptidase [Terriglobales bacterium]
MRTLTLLLVTLMATEVLSQPKPAPQPAAPLQAITDPRQLSGHGRLGVHRIALEQLYRTRIVGGSAWSPDAKQIAFITNISGRANLWLVPSAGGWPTQLTASDQRQASPAWSPDGKWIAYISDFDGNEQWDIFIVSPSTGVVDNLTNSSAVSEEAPAWSPDGAKIAYQRKPKDSPTYEIWTLDLLSRQPVAVTNNTPKDLGNFDPIWSPDGKRIAYTQTHAAGKDSSVFIADLAAGTHTNLTPHDGEKIHQAVAFSPDGKQLLITSNALNGHENVALLDITTKKLAWLTRDKWETQASGFSPDGKRVLWTSNVDGMTDAVLHDLATHASRRVPLDAGVNTHGGSESPFSRDGSRLLLYHNGPDAPNDLWTYDLAANRTTQITHSLFGGVRTQDMVRPQLVHYPSKDGKFTISAFAYVPWNLKRNSETGAIVYVHGGPQSQTVNSFNRIVQYLVNQGYVVIAPNYRGSTGYGKEFQDANRFDMGGGDLQDVLGAADWIAQTGFVDPKKLIIMGGSYGGYMTMMGVTKAPEKWAAGVAIVPFVNWFTEVEHEDPLLQQYDLATMGDPVKNKALWEDRSPINFVDHIRAPLLLLAGGHDPRCPKEESEQVEKAIKARGGEVELKIYENEGHGFARVENQIDAYTRVANFLRKHVTPADCGCEVQ